MYKFIRSVAHRLDLLSGEFIDVGETKSEEVKIAIIDYDESQFHEKEIKSMEEYLPYEKKTTVTWVNVDGLNIDVMEQIGKHFKLHNLILEDILNTGQHAMMEDFGNYIVIVLKMIYCENKSDHIIAEHVGLLIGENFVISFQENTGGDVFDHIRKNIRQGKGRIRKMGTAYLAYSLMDAIVDNYFQVLQKLAEEIELVEDDMVANPTTETLKTIYCLKRELIFLRKAIWPLRDVIGRLQIDEIFFKSIKGIYLRDLYDNLIQVIDTIETFREMLSGIIDIYMSSSANKMNQIMKVLTIISTIFIPMSFITGIYGMNIIMPEKDWAWTYPIVMALMLIIGISMGIYFKKKKWI